MRGGTGVLWVAAVALTMCAGSTLPPTQLSAVTTGPLSFSPTHVPVPSLPLPTTHVGSLAPAPGLG